MTNMRQEGLTAQQTNVNFAAAVHAYDICYSYCIILISVKIMSLLTSIVII